jgi:hypothetical protein
MTRVQGVNEADQGSYILGLHDASQPSSRAARTAEKGEAMRFWLGIGIVERFEGGEGTSLTFAQDGFSSFNDAVERLQIMEPPGAGGQVVEANAYVVQATTLEEARERLSAVFVRHGTSPHVKLVAANIPTREVARQPPDQEALSRVHGELCITHQIATLATSLAYDGDYRDRLVRHQEAIEDLGYALRVMQAETAAGESPELPPRGRARLGYGEYRLGGSESATLTSTLSSLATELSIAQHQVRVAQDTLPHRDQRLDELGAELSTFAATVSEYA